jgi:hypothetical protein
MIGRVAWAWRELQRREDARAATAQARAGREEAINSGVSFLLGLLSVLE